MLGSAELLLDEGPEPRHLRRVFVARLGRRPIDVALEGVDVRLGVRAEVDVVGVLVHVQGQDRDASRRGLPVIGRILVDELAIPRNVDEQHPPRATRQALRHRYELSAPAIH
jgi:hypothetical protein